MSQNPTPKAQAATVQIKLMVNNAAEAVQAIHERFGDAGKVLSVRQVEADGLKRLIQKPRLEVIVEVPSAALAEKPSKPAPELKSPAPAAEKPAAPIEEKPVEEPVSKKPIANLYSKPKGAPAGDYFGSFAEKEPAPEAPLGSAANPVKRGTLDASKRIVSMLRSLGFDESLTERIRSELDLQNLGNIPAADLYSRVCVWLQNHFPDTKFAPLGLRRAFIGSSGSGKTSAMCKALSSAIFLEGREPMALKIDGDVPNSSDGLEAFCDIMGAPLFRSADEIEEVSSARPLFIDTPGVDFSSAASVARLRAQLDELEVDERILVVNAAYESELIAEAISAGQRLGATRLVFSHLDETRRAGKLWKYALNERSRPWFFSHGPNPAGDYSAEVFSMLLDKTFPRGRAMLEAGHGGASEAEREPEAVSR